MGTRHLKLVYYKGKYRISQYGQWDGYPSGQGITVLTFIKDPANMEKLKAVLDKPGMLYEPSEAELDEIYERMEEAFQTHFRIDASKITDEEEINKHIHAQPARDAAPSISRDTGAGILKVVADATQPLPIENSIAFLTDRMMCEWVYVVDLDEGVFEVFSNQEGVKEVGGDGEKPRFSKKVEGLKGAKYFPPRVGTWKMSQLPTEEALVGSLIT